MASGYAFRVASASRDRRVIFFHSFAAMGYSAWNVAVAFLFAGGLFAASVGLNRRPLAVQVGFVTVLLAAFVATIIYLAPIVADAARVNENWEQRRETDDREIRRRQQFEPAQPAPAGPSQPATD